MGRQDKTLESCKDAGEVFAYTTGAIVGWVLGCVNERRISAITDIMLQAERRIDALYSGENVLAAVMQECESHRMEEDGCDRCVLYDEQCCPMLRKDIPADFPVKVWRKLFGHTPPPTKGGREHE